MTKIIELKDIEVYKEALELARKVYKLTRNSKLIREFSLVDQIRRASLSVPANIAEGFGRKSKKDFAQFLSVALGSLNEVNVYLDFIKLEFSIDTSDLQDKYNLLGRRIYSFRSYLLKSN